MITLKTIATVPGNWINLHFDELYVLFYLSCKYVLLFPFLPGKNGDNALLSTSDGRVYGTGENTCGCLGLEDSSSYGLPSEMKLSKKGLKGKGTLLYPYYLKTYNSILPTNVSVLPFLYVPGESFKHAPCKTPIWSVIKPLTRYSSLSM